MPATLAPVALNQHLGHVSCRYLAVIESRVDFSLYLFVTAKYLQNYLDEFAFRGSHRSERDAMVSLVLACC